MITKTKVLIIKLGHSETLDPVISKECSLGDVVRTTVILNYFKDVDNVTWLVDEKAEPLLQGNPRIRRVLTWSWEVCFQLLREKFDVVVNLEKAPHVCVLSDSINAWQKYGFRFNDWTGVAEAHYHTEKVLDIAHNTAKRDNNKKYWQEHLARVIDERWSIKDTYIMPPRKERELYDFGFNWKVGSKWPEKAWPTHLWFDLEDALKRKGFIVSLQPDLDLEAYMAWIKSCKHIITCDSLGMHLAIAYNKRVTALFGPTPHQEVFFYNKGASVVSPTGLMTDITTNDVYKTAMEVHA